MKPLTTKQTEVLAFIRQYFAENDTIPTSRRIGKEFGIAQTAALQHMNALKRAGILERNEANGWRFSRAGKEEVGL